MAYSRIQETSTSTSSSTISLGGAMVGYLPFSKRHAVGETGIEVVIVDGNGNWLEGVYTLTDAATLTRTAILSSSNNDADVTFAAGSKSVFEVLSGSSIRGGMINQNDVGFDIIVLAGQSNMAGRGTVDSNMDVSDSRIWQYGCDSGTAATFQKICRAVDPLSHAEAASNTQLGPGMPFARAYASMTPAHRQVLLVPVAVGSTVLVGGDWAPGNPGGTLYENAITRANAALTAAKLIYPNSRIVGILWGQGEGDAINGTSQAAYASANKSLISGFRSRMTGAANAWVIINGMVPENITANSATYTPIKLAHQQVANETDRCWYVDGVSGYANGVHYLAQGYRILGAKAAMAVPSAIRYRAADTTSPTALSAAVANATPTYVDITMSEPMDTNYTPAASSVTISGHTVSALAWNSNTVLRATVSAAFAYGESQTVAYTQPGTNNVRDLAGNLLANFTALAITNNVAAPASALTLSLSSSTVTSGSPVTVTVGTDHPLTGSQSETVTLTAPVAGTWSANPVTLDASHATAAPTFTPSATGSGNITASASGTPALTGASSPLTVTAAATAPGAPTIGTATAGANSASVSFTPPASDGGAAITGYTATATPVGGGTAVTATGASSPINVTGLTAGTAYTLTVHATNSVGPGPESAASNSVTPTAPASSTTTWSPTDKQSQVTLTNGNLTASSTSGYISARATTGKSSGKWYWEVTIGTNPLVVGAGESGAALTSYPGSDQLGWGYHTTSGTFYHNGATSTTFATTVAGDVLGFALDMDNKTIRFYKNGIAQGTGAIALQDNGTTAIAAGTSVYPMIGVSSSNGTANFGATAFAYTPPAGFSALPQAMIASDPVASGPVSGSTTTNTVSSDLTVSYAIGSFVRSDLQLAYRIGNVGTYVSINRTIKFGGSKNKIGFSGSQNKVRF